MKTLICFLKLIFLINQAYCFTITELDSNLIQGQFRRSTSGFKTINIDPGVLVPSVKEDITISLRSFFDEQCAIECLKNILCIGYLFQEAKESCLIYLRPNFRRQNNIINNQKLKENLRCDLQRCSQALYCSSSSSDNLDGVCLCDFVLNTGQNCSIKNSYQISEWSKWTECSAECGDGLSSRKKVCSKNLEILPNSLNWLCDKNLIQSGKFEVEHCKTKSCKTYSEWSNWSTCSKICGGTKTRQRSCFLDAKNKLCDEKYLREIQYCSLDECTMTIIKLQNTDLNPGNITKRGFLKLYNQINNLEIRIFSYTNDQTEVSKIGQVACLEFGFTRSIYTNPKEINDLKSKFSKDTDYLQFLNKKSISGIKCIGNETSIKECSYGPNAFINTTLYELEVECLFNGYFSVWSAWPPCSVTCGAGARARTRVCNDPPPSVSETNRGNGAVCSGQSMHLENCVMPRCKS